jgi:PEP-CTERM motif
MKLLGAIVGLVVLACTAFVRGQDLDFQVQAGAMTQTITLASGPNDTWTYSSGTMTLGSSKIYTAPIGNTGQSGLVIDADPSINYGFGVTNNGTTTQKYTFTFPMPSLALAVNLPAGTYTVSASFGDTLTAAPGDTAQFSLDGATTTYQQSFIDGSNAGVDIVVPAGQNPETVTAPSNGTNTGVFSFTNSTGTFTVASTGTAMSVTTTFDLSPGDSASFSGSFVVEAVPEPASVGLGLLALGAFAGLVIRARRTRA